MPRPPAAAAPERRPRRTPGVGDRRRARGHRDRLVRRAALRVRRAAAGHGARHRLVDGGADRCVLAGHAGLRRRGDRRRAVAGRAQSARVDDRGVRARSAARRGVVAGRVAGGLLRRVGGARAGHGGRALRAGVHRAHRVVRPAPARRADHADARRGTVEPDLLAAHRAPRRGAGLARRPARPRRCPLRDHGAAARGHPAACSAPSRATVHSPAAATRLALRQPAFWLLAGAFALASFTTAALSVHLVALLVEDGHDLALAATLAGLVGLAQAPGRLGLALLGRVVPGRRSAPGIFAAATLAVACSPPTRACPRSSWRACCSG